MKRDPFVCKTLEDIRKAQPSQYGTTVVLLISYRFQKAVLKEIKEREDQFDLIKNEPITLESLDEPYEFLTPRNITIRGVPAMAVMWLADGEFEIRPKSLMFPADSRISNQPN